MRKKLLGLIAIMKKKLVGLIALVAFVLTMALNVSFGAKSNYLSDISLANVEALARSEVSIALCYADFTHDACCDGPGVKYAGSCGDSK